MNPTSRILLLALISSSTALFAGKSPRSRASFDDGWRFARFGLQADGTRIEERGGERWSIRLTASTEVTERGNLISQAMDGKTSTRWCASGPEAAQWMALDLGKPTALGAVAIEWDVSPAWKETRLPYGFVFEGSKDAESWTQLADESAATGEADPVTLPLKGNWRHLLIRTTSVLGTQWASIREIRLTDAAGHPIENRLINDNGSPAAPGFSDINWRKLDLPHDWGIEGPVRVDLTDHLKPGVVNVIAVRLDTEKWDSRWYPGAGIYRHTWFVSTNAVSVAHRGTSITTPEVSPPASTVKIAVTVTNATSADAKATVSTEILEIDAHGKPGAKVADFTSSEADIPATGNTTASQQASLPNPKLWDIAHPKRYLACTTVCAGGKVMDDYDKPFGIRTIEANPHDGFKLNGKRVPLQGVCMHHDLGALGAALNDRALERQVQILKEMGCNAWRTSHNPPAPELLEICDRLGMLVVDEAFDAWATGKRPNDSNKLYPEWHEKDLHAMVHRDRNHPSVIMWSIGNGVMNQQDVAMTPVPDERAFP